MRLLENPRQDNERCTIPQAACSPPARLVPKNAPLHKGSPLPIPHSLKKSLVQRRPLLKMLQLKWPQNLLTTSSRRCLDNCTPTLRRRRFTITQLILCFLPVTNLPVYRIRNVLELSLRGRQQLTVPLPLELRPPRPTWPPVSYPSLNVNFVDGGTRPWNTYRAVWSLKTWPTNWVVCCPLFNLRLRVTRKPPLLSITSLFAPRTPTL